MYIWQCTESGWDGGNFLLSIPGFGCDWKSVGNTAVLVIAEQCVHSIRAFSLLALPLQWAESLERAQPAHLAQTGQQGYSMT